MPGVRRGCLAAWNWVREQWFYLVLVVVGLVPAILPFLPLGWAGVSAGTWWLRIPWWFVAYAPPVLGMLLIGQLLNRLSVRATQGRWYLALVHVLLFYVFFAMTYTGGFAVCHGLGYQIVEKGRPIAGNWFELFYFAVITGATI